MAYGVARQKPSSTLSNVMLLVPPALPVCSIANAHIGTKGGSSKHPSSSQGVWHPSQAASLGSPDCHIESQWKTSIYCCKVDP